MAKSVSRILSPWPNAKARREACARLCAHLAEGHSVLSFPEADASTVREHMELFPRDFPRAALEAAARQGLQEWERVGMAGARGDLPKFNASAWGLVMKTRVDLAGGAGGGVPGLLPAGSDGDNACRCDDREQGEASPRAAAQVALAVMALFSREDVAVHEQGAGNADRADRPDGRSGPQHAGETAGGGRGP